MNYLETYESLYHKSPEGEVFCPYRPRRSVPTLTTSTGRATDLRSIRESTSRTVRKKRCHRALFAELYEAGRTGAVDEDLITSYEEKPRAPKGASRCAAVLFLSPGGREADSGSIGRGVRCGRSGKLRGVAEPPGADARVRDAGEAV